MGLSSKTQKSSTKPVYAPQIEAAAGNISSAYNAQAPKITGITDQLAGLVPGLMDRYTNGDANVNAAKTYNTDVLSGKYLDAGNPYLDAIVDKSANTARNETAGALGTRGLTGGSAFADIISRNVNDASNTLRYNDYNTERGRMDTAAGQAGSLAAAGELPLASLMSILQAQSAPVSTAAGAGAATGGLLGQYTNQKQTYTPSTMDSIGQALDIGKVIAGFFPSDRRLKTAIHKVGEYADGLGIYLYNYVWGGPRFKGVMADEVAELRPWALGPRVDGFATVNYGVL